MGHQTRLSPARCRICFLILAHRPMRDKRSRWTRARTRTSIISILLGRILALPHGYGWLSSEVAPSIRTLANGLPRYAQVDWQIFERKPTFVEGGATVGLHDDFTKAPAIQTM